MPFAATDDGAENNPRVVRLEDGTFMRDALGYGNAALQRGAAFGFLSLLGSWSGRHFTDMHFPEFMVRRVCGENAEWFVKACQAAGLLGKKKVKGKDGDLGWQFVDNGDQLINVLTKEQVEANRKKGVRNGEEVAARLRDGDQCRYCAKAVQFGSRKGWMRGTYLPDPRPAHREHPDPADRTRWVVACGQCNQSKGEQTPEEWGHPLLPVPDKPLYNADTLDLFRRHGIRDVEGERERVLLWSGDVPAADLVRAAEPHRAVPVPSTPGSGRASGQVGQSGVSGSGGTGSVVPLRSVDDEPGPGGAA